jgi:ribonuclease P/MRP protein subunit POP5
VEFLNPELNETLTPLSASKIYHAIKDSVINNFGDAGWGAVGVSLSGLYHSVFCIDNRFTDSIIFIVKYYSPTTCLCIIRVGRDHLPIARAAVTLLSTIEASPVIPVVHHCSGKIQDPPSRHLL